MRSTPARRPRTAWGRSSSRTPSSRCSCSPSVVGLCRMRRVAELAELAGHEVRDLLPDVDRMVADPLDTARDDEHAQAVLALRGRVTEGKDVLGGVPVRPIDQLVEIDERLCLVGVALGEGVEGDADHLLAALPHVLDRTADV